MFRGCATSFLLLAFCLFFSGCHTMKGAASGAEKDIQNCWEATKKVVDSLKKADQKMQEALW